MYKHIQKTGVALALGAMLALAGCGTTTVSKNISDNGRAGEVVFPSIEQSAWLKEGTFPNLDNLRRVGPGMSKDQLYDLLGRPHFGENLLNVREWDYVFNFRTGGGVTTCQFKAIFDTELRAQTFHWLPANCADFLAVAPAPTPVERVVDRPVERTVERTTVTPAPRRIELSADALFAFGKSSSKDLKAGGLRELDELAKSLRGMRDLGTLRITGHSDRIGSAATNDRLSLARATTVRDYLVGAGVPLVKMTVIGKGKSEPKVDCNQKNRQALIDCLAPNRRVEIEVTGAQS